MDKERRRFIKMFSAAVSVGIVSTIGIMSSPSKTKALNCSCYCDCYCNCYVNCYSNCYGDRSRR